MFFELTEEQQAVQQAARDFAQNILKPGVIDRDREMRYPKAEVRQMAEMGFLGMMVAPEYGGGGMDTMSYVLAMEEISKVVPFFAGVKWEKLGDNGKQWPVRKDGSDTEILHTETFTRGKGKFMFNAFRESEEIVQHTKEYPYINTTNRELEHYNCGAMTRRTRNAEILTEDVLLICEEDALKHKIEDGDMVCVESPRGKVDIKAKITDEVKPGILSSTFHFPDMMLNNITSSISDTEAMCPEYKVVACTIRKSKGKYKAKENGL